MRWLAQILTTAHADGSAFMPPQGTQVAVDFDNLYSFLLWASLISCVILIGGMIFFAMKYKRKTNTDKTAYITHNSFLEFLWSFIPFVLFMMMFVWGWSVYNKMRTFPADSLEINVVGHQWAWDFNYKSGKVSMNEFYVPVNTPIKLIMTSRDVIHSFYIPSMRIKQDVVPGRYTALGFNADKTGDYQIFCAQYCGGAHSKMWAKLHVVPMDEYEKWLQENDEGLTLAQKGEKLYNGKGCVACHSIDGSIKVGPSWKGAWGSTREFEDGRTQVYDENYFRNCVLNPSTKTVKGFPKGVMVSFQGQLSEDQMAQLIEYVKSLK
jgi:cytochrome c oxidase subunit 2